MSSWPRSFYPLTVLTGCQPDMGVLYEETFGPVAPVRVVADFDAALRAAADDTYGLAANVLTVDMAHAHGACPELPLGTVKIKDVFGGARVDRLSPARGAGRASDTALNCWTR